MTYTPHSWVLGHFDWYNHVPGKGYIPTDKAPPNAVEALKHLNEFIKKKYGKL